MIIFQAAVNLASHLYSEFVTNRHQTSSQDAASKTEAESTEYLVRNWLEAMFARLQIAVLWQDSLLTLKTISYLVAAVMMFNYLDPSFYATIFMALFCYNLVIFWFRYVWPSIRVPPESGSEQESRLDMDRFTHLHPNLITLDELGQIAKNLMKISEYYLDRILEKRREKPLHFCAATCLLLTLTAIIGCLISGYKLMVIIGILSFITPRLFVELPDDTYQLIRGHILMIIHQDDDETSSDENSSNQQTSTTTAIEMLLARLKCLGPLVGTQSDNQSKEEKTCSTESSSNVPKEGSSKTQNIRPEVRFSRDLTIIDDGPRIENKDLSSNSSPSLNDSEDEQQDGFVIL